MDIFNREKVAELEQKLVETEIDRNHYMNQAAILAEKLEEVTKLNETIPKNCTKGPWCKACEFVRTFHYIEYYGFSSRELRTVYACAKGVSCENFVQREVEE